tara:strand:- start:552 stop:836 length:285 start_codon:yes stop_codon:yes gene_type:complete
MTTYTTAAKEFGEVELDGKKLALIEQAELTNRVFPNWFGDAEEGDTYIAEYGAPAIDNEGNTYLVIWQFDETKGQEQDDASNYNWDNVYSVSFR